MSTPIPPGFLLQRVEFVPPDVKVVSGRLSQYAWIHERMLDMKINNGCLMITVPDKRTAQNIHANITAFSKRHGDKLLPPRRYKPYTAPADNKADGLYHVFVECITT